MVNRKRFISRRTIGSSLSKNKQDPIRFMAIISGILALILVIPAFLSGQLFTAFFQQQSNLLHIDMDSNDIKTVEMGEYKFIIQTGVKCIDQPEIGEFTHLDDNGCPHYINTVEVVSQTGSNAWLFNAVPRYIYSVINKPDLSIGDYYNCGCEGRGQSLDVGNGECRCTYLSNFNKALVKPSIISYNILSDKDYGGIIGLSNSDNLATANMKVYKNNELIESISPISSGKYFEFFSERLGSIIRLGLRTSIIKDRYGDWTEVNSGIRLQPSIEFYDPVITSDKLQLLSGEESFITVSINAPESNDVIFGKLVTRYKVPLTLFGGEQEYFTKEKTEQIILLQGGTHEYQYLVPTGQVTDEVIIEPVLELYIDSRADFIAPYTIASNVIRDDTNQYINIGRVIGDSVSFSISQIPFICTEADKNNVQTCSDYLITLFNNNRIDLDGMITAIEQLQLEQNVKQDLINQLDVTIAEQQILLEGLQARIIENEQLIYLASLEIDQQAEQIKLLNLTIKEQAILILELHNNVNDQARLITELQLSIDNQIILIDSMELTITKQASLINNLELTIQEQSQLITGLYNEIEQQTILINELTDSLARKSLIITQITTENEQQAEYIRLLEDSLVNQGKLLDEFNKELSEEAKVIKLLTDSNFEQGIIITGLKENILEQGKLINELELTIEEQLILISGMKLSIKEQGKLINELELTVEEQILIIKGLEDSIVKQGIIIESMELNLEELSILVDKMELNIQEQAILITELKLNNEDLNLVISNLQDSLVKEQELSDLIKIELNKKEQQLSNLIVYSVIGVAILGILLFMLIKKK